MRRRARRPSARRAASRMRPVFAWLGVLRLLRNFPRRFCGLPWNYLFILKSIIFF
jgi:hypothetical protein